MNSLLKKKFTVILIMVSITFIGCNNGDKVSKSQSNANLLSALLNYNQVQTLQAAEMEINGYWTTGFYLAGQFTANGNLLISTNQDGTGTWSSTCYGTFCNDRVNRIIQFSNTTRNFYYQQGQGNNNNFGTGFDNREKFGRIDWTSISTTGCESSATKCFYYCEGINSKNTLAEAQADTTSITSTNPTLTGCGGFAWSRALFRTGNPTWAR